MTSLLFSEFESFIARYDAITQIRIERALDAMSQQGRQVFELLPVLLHFNHPLLPGYVSGEVPHGVATLTLSPSQQQFIDDPTRNEEFTHYMSQRDSVGQFLEAMEEKNIQGAYELADKFVITSYSIHYTKLYEKSLEYLSL